MMSNEISLEQAIEMTTRYREHRDKIIVPDLLGKNVLPTAETFERNAFDKLLSRPGCKGLRVYFGMKADLQLRVIIVGVNEDNQDMLPKEQVLESGNNLTNSDGDDEDPIIEEGAVCPPICSEPSPLNP